MALHTIGQVARQSGVGVETVRFYEREGLIPQPCRPESGFRRYPQDAVLVDGRLSGCCAGRGPREETLRTAGVGTPIP